MEPNDDMKDYRDHRPAEKAQPNSEYLAMASTTQKLDFEEEKPSFPKPSSEPPKIQNMEFSEMYHSYESPNLNHYDSVIYSSGDSDTPVKIAATSAKIKTGIRFFKFVLLFLLTVGALLGLAILWTILQNQINGNKNSSTEKPETIPEDYDVDTKIRNVIKPFLPKLAHKTKLALQKPVG